MTAAPEIGIHRFFDRPDPDMAVGVEFGEIQIVLRHMLLDVLLMQHLGLIVIIVMRCWKDHNGLIRHKV